MRRNDTAGLQSFQVALAERAEKKQRGAEAVLADARARMDDDAIAIGGSARVIGDNGEPRRLKWRGSWGAVGEQSATRLNSILATPRENGRGRQLGPIRTQQRTTESGQTLSGTTEVSALGAGVAVGANLAVAPGSGDR